MGKCECGRLKGNPCGPLRPNTINVTMPLAVIVGLIMVNLIQPGEGRLDADALEALAAQGQEITADHEDKDFTSIISNLALMLFTDNLFLSASQTNLLPLIFFSIFFAGMLTTMGRKVQAITELIPQINEALLAFILR